MMEKRTSRIISFCLVLAMLLALVPAFPIAANAATTYSVKVYFKDTDGWGTVYGYAWNGTGTEMLGSWPGSQLSYDGSTGCYVFSCDYTPASGTTFNFIFNNNNGGQTGDLQISNANLASHQQWWVSGPAGSPTKMSLPVNNNGKVTFTYESSTASTVQLAGSMTDWSGVTMTESNNVFTYTCDLVPGAYEYKFIVDGSWINDPCNPYTTGTDNNNVFIVSGLQATTLNVVKGVATELPSVLSYTDNSGNSSQKAVSYTVPSSYSSYATLSGNTLTVSSAYTGSTMTLTAATTDGETTTVTLKLVESSSDIPTVKLHFVNTLGWQGVCAYAWSNATTSTFNGGTWPGKVVDRDGVGIHTMEITHTPASGETLGVLFHNNDGAQTADITISYAQIVAGSELWIIPGAANDEGKYTCTVTDDASKAIYSPVVNGNQVTFKYSGSATSVYLAGSFNDWSSTATKMTKGSDGVWSVTLTLDPGVHEYKFIVNGEWTHDPLNGIIGGYDGNSVAVVPGDDTVEEGKIKVVLHFYRESGDYIGWDVWFWDNASSGAASFSDDPVNKGKIATYYVDGISNSNVGYTVRKSDWSDKEFYDRFIDLSDVVGGTVHYFLNSGSESGSRVLGADAINGPKVTDARLDYSTGKLYPSMSMPVSGNVADAFGIYDSTGADKDIAITSVDLVDGQYVLTLNKKLGTNGLSNYKVTFNGTEGPVWLNTHDLFYNGDFNSDYNYTGDDLGATWSKNSTTFKVWAPTAKHVQVLRYAGGNYGGDDWIETVDMTLGEKGVWSATVSGDLNGTYYNYLVHFDNYTVEATDPYAKSTGANGDRGMVLDMDSTDPVGWDSDVSPNQNMSYTDAIIYEMHVREFTIDESSGVTNKGKYLGLTESGTNYNGYSTGLAHLKELGITHVQLMPVYDYSSVDEYKLTEWAQYAWGYDPKNYNVPEGSYSTDPFNGEVRVTEFKQMVQTLHRNGINVIMDVVYNHAFDGGNFCYNKIVPNYFSRFFGEGNWSNGSGVGNDMATERAMARNFIVDSILHWVEEYHIDGFRFDLAGLIDNQTINEIVNTVHAKYPNVMFYGEGWAPGDTAEEYGTTLTTKDNAWTVPGFGFFNDNFRNDIAGDNGNSWGFATGDTGKADAIANYFRASNGWSTSPTQTINYVSCHDNYSLMDKIIISKNGTEWLDMVKMNNLSAAIYMMAQGIPFIYSGEELLREKKDANGNRYDNAYGTDDYINKLRWSDLQNKTYAQMTDDYYAGLVEFRKNHAALRNPGGADAWNYTTYYKINDQTIMFYIDGYPNWECSDGIVIIYNASTSSQWVNLYDYGVPSGYWQATVHGTQAGNSALWGVNVTDSSGSVGVDPISATVLVLGDLVHEESVYNQNLSLVECKHTAHDQNGVCTTCGATVGHNYSSVVTKPTCTVSGYTTHTCSGCGHVYRNNATAALGHSYTGGSCTVPGTCSTCGAAQPSAPGHTWGETCADSAVCGVCDAVKLYFDNSSAGWSTVYLYTWDAADAPYTGEWPGSAMTQESDGTWSYVVPDGALHVIFSNGTEQTDNLTIPTDGNNLYADGAWIPADPSVHSYESVTTAPSCTEEGYTTNTCTVCGNAYVSDPVPANGHIWDESGETCVTCGAVKIYFDNSSSNWETVYIYTWDADNNVCTGFWPGYAMTDEGDGILSCGVSTDAVCVVFSNESGEKTDDLTIPTDGSNLYVYAENTWKVYGACSHDYNVESVNATCTEDGYTRYTCSVCGHSYSETIPALGHTYEDGQCTLCGEADPDQAVTQPTIQPLGPGLAFKDEIYYNIYFGVNNPDNVEIAEMGVMTWTSAIDGTVDTAEYVCPGTEPYYTTYFKARTQPISAKNMGEQLYIKIYLKLADGTYVYSSLLNYSAKDYATNKLATSNDDGLKALCVALMNYGAAAQQYFGHKTDELMNAGLTDEQKALVDDYSDTMIPAMVDAGTKDDDLGWTGGYSALQPSVNFGGALGINYLFTPNKTMDGEMKLYVWTEADLENIETMTLDNASQVITMTSAGSGKYSARVGGIAAKNAGDTIYACGVYESNGEVCRTGVLAYSVAAYCQSFANNSNSSFQPMAATAAVYTYYANAYLGN